MTVNDTVARCRDHLSRLPFVSVIAELDEPELKWRIETHEGSYTLRIVTKPRADYHGTLYVAERIHGALKQELERNEASYVDASGNLRLKLGGQFAVVTGKTPPTKVKPMRAPAYRVLLTWLLDPAKLGSSLRTTAEIAEVSRTAVQDMRVRLNEWGYVVGETKPVWTDRGRREARRLWLDGYRMLRDELDLGGYRLVGGGPISSNLTYVREQLARHRVVGDRRWLWEGLEALRHVPEMETFFVDDLPLIRVTIDPALESVSSALPLERSDIYNVRVRRLPFSAAARYHGPRSWPDALPHPLLIWSELMCDRDPRVHEAARELEEMVPEWI